MSNLKRIIPASLAIPTALVAVACGVSPPAATPTPENTPLPTATPTLELPQRPPLPAPTMEGAVDPGGYKLRYQCFGDGTPTVIVEAGGGDKPTRSSSWNAVILGVYPATRICIYDRVDGVRTSQDIAEDLHDLLNKISAPGPYVLVAHSIGGYHARVFAHLYPEEVAGMILVDTTPTYPDAWTIYATAYPTYSPDEPTSITVYRVSEAAISTNIPPSIDGLDMRASSEQVRQAGSFGDIPLVVISHTPGPADLSGLSPDPVVQEQFAAILLKIQADMATLSSRGVFMEATTTKHFISEYEPQIIVDAITRMVEEIRNH